MWNRWVFHSDERFDGTVMIISLSTGLPQYFLLYSQARELAKFLLERFGARKLATYYSSTMEDFVQVNDDGVAELPSYSVHMLEIPGAKEKTLLFSGYSSPRDHTYEFCEHVLGVAKERWGVKRIVSVGARWSEEPTQAVVDEVKVYGYGATKEDAQFLRGFGILENPTEIAPYFANVIVGLAPLYGISAVKLSVDHGEIRPHPRQVKALVQTLGRILGFDLDLSELDAEAEKLKTEVNLISKVNTGKNRSYDDPSFI
jgi:proteasome assembly chaperone (PAC2) family protein